MSRKLTWLSCLIATAYLLLFVAVAMYFHHRSPLEAYYLALAQTMQVSGFSFIANWQQIPLIHLAPFWVWLSEINAHTLGANVALLRLWSGLMGLWTFYITMRFTQHLIAQEKLTAQLSPPICALILLALTPTTVWFTLTATPWATVTAAIMTAVYASFAYARTYHHVDRFYWAYWVSLWLITLAAGLLFVLPLLFLPFCWSNRAAAKKLLSSVRGWVIGLLLYGAWVYAAYQAAGLIVFSHANLLWWLTPSHGAYSNYNPFLPSALPTLTDMPVWLSIAVLLPLLMLLPVAVRWWQLNTVSQRYGLTLLVFALVYSLCIGFSQDLLSAFFAWQIIAPLLAVAIAPCLATLFTSRERHISALTHGFALFIGFILLLGVAVPRFHLLLPMLNPAMRIALVAIIVIAYVPLIVARWVNLHTAVIVWMALLIASLFSFTTVQYHYQQQQSLAPLFKIINTQATSKDVIANVGQLRPELWLATHARVVQISPITAQISVPANPLLVSPLQFAQMMHANGRRAWIIINMKTVSTMPLEAKLPYIMLLAPDEPKGIVGDTVLFGPRNGPIGNTISLTSSTETK